MVPVKERIIGAVALMTNEEAEDFWSLIKGRYILVPKSWDSIEEEEADEEDIRLLNEIATDPDCSDFISSKAAMQMLELNPGSEEV